MWLDLLVGRVAFASAAAATAWLAQVVEPLEIAAASGPVASRRWAAAVEQAMGEGLAAARRAPAPVRHLLEAALQGKGARLDVQGAVVAFRSRFDDGEEWNLVRAAAVASCFARASATGVLFQLGAQPADTARPWSLALCLEAGQARLVALSFEDALDVQGQAEALDPDVFDPAAFFGDERSADEELEPDLTDEEAGGLAPTDLSDLLDVDDAV